MCVCKQRCPHSPINHKLIQAQILCSSVPGSAVGLGDHTLYSRSCLAPCPQKDNWKDQIKSGKQRKEINSRWPCWAEEQRDPMNPWSLSVFGVLKWDPSLDKRPRIYTSKQSWSWCRHCCPRVSGSSCKVSWWVVSTVTLAAIVQDHKKRTPWHSQGNIPLFGGLVFQ